MKAFFDLPAFDGQLMRALSLAYYRGADYGECLSTAARIQPGDLTSWFEEWHQTAERLTEKAVSSEKKGHLKSSQEFYFRAANYYRTACFFLYGAPVDPRLVQAYDKHMEAFEKGMRFNPFSAEKIAIPFEQTHLTGYFFRSQEEKKPTLILNSGYDGTCQEAFFSNGIAALERGYHVLCYDGPGQGHALIKQGLYMRPNWETVISPIMDYLSGRSDVDAKRIALLGQSWGGILVPRAACFEHRLAAIIASPGQSRPV